MSFRCLASQVDALNMIAATSRSPPEGLLHLVEAIRGNNSNNSHGVSQSEPIPTSATFVQDRPLTSTLHSGLNQAREYDDPSGNWFWHMELPPPQTLMYYL